MSESPAAERKAAAAVGARSQSLAQPGAGRRQRALGREQRAAPAHGPAGARPARGPQSPSRASSDRQPVSLPAQLVLPSATTEPADMSFPQLGYPQYLSAAGPGAYGGERPGVLAAAAAAAAAASSGRPGTAELGAGAGAAAVTSVLGMYAAAGPYAGAPNYSAFLPYAADLSLFSQMVSAPASRASSWPAPTGDLGARGQRERLAEKEKQRICRQCLGKEREGSCGGDLVAGTLFPGDSGMPRGPASDHCGLGRLETRAVKRVAR